MVDSSITGTALPAVVVYEPRLTESLDSIWEKTQHQFVKYTQGDKSTPICMTRVFPDPLCAMPE